MLSSPKSRGQQTHDLLATLGGFIPAIADLNVASSGIDDCSLLCKALRLIMLK